MGYPLENVERVIIDDYKGLDYLLSRTVKNERREWGTFLKAYCDGDNTAHIYHILNYERGREMRLIGRGCRFMLIMNCGNTTRMGYNGCHHYHSTILSKFFGGSYFTISSTDRYKPLGWLNLLTFNLPEGPESGI